MLENSSASFKLCKHTKHAAANSEQSKLDSIARGQENRRKAMAGVHGGPGQQLIGFTQMTQR